MWPQGLSRVGACTSPPVLGTWPAWTFLQRGKQEWVCDSWKGTSCGRQRVSPRGAQRLVLGREVPAPSLAGAPYLPLAAIQVIQ